MRLIVRGIALSSPLTLMALLALMAAGCGDSSGNNNGDDGGVTGDATAEDAPWVDFSDADPNAPDAGANTGCMASDVQCNNCVDDDGDNLIDGFDPHCTSSLDDDEETFATGIPGDNKDAIKQDCFFDGNSGGGDDKCDLHVCCLLTGECPAHLKPELFDPNDCTLSDECKANCGPLTPPGCDCFGCCTICEGTECHDVITNPAVAPNCDVDVLDDPASCPPCNKVADCGTDCDPANCILCPGQTPEDLPAECTDPVCPNDLTECTTTADCLSNQFCSQGCCINAID
jgi:hypothetical protein